MTHVQTPSGLWVADGYVNMVANLGNDRDKATFGSYRFTPPTPDQLLAMYRSAWLPRKIINLPVRDATRKWRTWKAKAPQITKIEKLEKQLGLKRKVKEAKQWARLFGGAAIYINTGERDVSKPLDPTKVKAIRSLTVLTPNKLAAGEINRDIESDFYDRPETFMMESRIGEILEIHASRFIMFEGAAVPDSSYRLNGWGDSLLAAVMQTITQSDSVPANIASLLFEAKVDVFRFQGLMEQLGTDDSLITKRLMAQATLKGINGAVVLDKEDEYDQKNASFGGLPEIMDRFMLLVSGASDIPVTRLFGRSAAGLSGSGDGDERVYYDAIEDIQTDEIGAPMQLFDECLVTAALGSRPAEIWYEWAPLRQITEKERADIFKTTADGARALAGSRAGEIIPVDALSDSLVNELTEQGVLPGLDAKIEEYGSLSEQEPDEEDLIAAAPPPADPDNPDQLATVAQDAAPRTLYVHRKVLNGGEIVEWAKAQGFTSTLKAEDLHVNIMFSRKPVDWMKMGESWMGREDDGKLMIAPGGARMMDRFDGGATVLLFASSELSWRHENMRREGASWDHAEYQPHITISYEGAPTDLKAIEPYRGKIELGPEIFEEVKEDWLETVTEE